jgi:ParB-like chromosome segregation protein Spo0J
MQRRLEFVKLGDIDLEDTTFCARLEFTDEEIHALADSIESLGLRNPPGYVRKSRKLVVNYGWHRTLAIKRLGWEEISAFLNYGNASKRTVLG